MDTTSVDQATRERVLRGIALHEGSGIEHVGHGVYEVAGTEGWVYTVDLAPFGGAESCGCKDRHYRPGLTCKHLAAASIFAAKARLAARRVAPPEVRAGGGRSEP